VGKQAEEDAAADDAEEKPRLQSSALLPAARSISSA
jgi:hypothetical protein